MVSRLWSRHLIEANGSLCRPGSKLVHMFTLNWKWDKYIKKPVYNKTKQQNYAQMTLQQAPWCWASPGKENILSSQWQPSNSVQAFLMLILSQWRTDPPNWQEPCSASNMFHMNWCIRKCKSSGISCDMSFTKFNDMFDYKGLMIWFASNEIHAFTLQILMDASYSFSKSVPFGNVASSNQSATGREITRRSYLEDWITKLNYGKASSKVS